MLNTKEYFNQLDATLAIKELDNETATAIQGGALLELYDTRDYKQLLGSFNYGGKPRLIANDQISSIKIKGGQWRFYEDADYKGAAYTLGKGNYKLGPGTAYLNNQISSFQKVG